MQEITRLTNLIKTRKFRISDQLELLDVGIISSIWGCCPGESASLDWIMTAVETK